jgi:transcriptional regulator with XRE-family HTH domain
MVNFSEWLKAELEKKGLLQKELAGMMNVSEGIVSRYISGKDLPSPINLIKMAKIFDLPEKEVLAIGGYDENYNRIPIQRNVEKEVSITYQIEPKSPEQEEKDLDAEIQDLCKHFQGVFLDKRGDLSIESKKVVIDVLKYVIQKEGGKTRKGE